MRTLQGREKNTAQAHFSQAQKKKQRKRTFQGKKKTQLKRTFQGEKKKRRQTKCGHL